MFDKITIQAKVSDDECVHLARAHSLHVVTDNNGCVVKYASGTIAKIEGIEICIRVGKRGNEATVKASLHKFWNKRTYGRLRNDNLFTMSEAKTAFGMMISELGWLIERVKIKTFEIGLNMEVSFEPLSFIELARCINNSEKWMFDDANYVIKRQKTSIKHDDIRKYYKIYDKTFEMKKKRRGKARLTEDDGRRVLRVETVHRRHDESARSFFSDGNLKRLVDRFYSDWSNLFFYRNINALKGAKKSEVERAKLTINMGADEYLEKMRAEYDEGRMTDKQFRTIREFVRDFDANSHRFKVVVSPREREFRRLLKQQYDIIKQ